MIWHTRYFHLRIGFQVMTCMHGIVFAWGRDPCPAEGFSIWRRHWDFYPGEWLPRLEIWRGGSFRFLLGYAAEAWTGRRPAKAAYLRFCSRRYLLWSAKP